MNIVYAAEKPSIARLMSEQLEDRVPAREIDVAPNPDETGSFLIRWRQADYVLSPDGALTRGDDPA